MRQIFILFVVIALSAVSILAQKTTEGALLAAGKKGKALGACPLKHTDVKADISGFIARVRVTQEFENNFAEPIEALYTFPLSQTAAVDDLTMRIGERTIRGRIMKRGEARKVYEQARDEGKTASLLDQERPNVFTQSVANILPGEKILIEISYVETLKYEDGNYEFVCPMTVGPRYIPGSVNAAEADRIAPPVAESRAGHDISIEVNLNAGVPVEEIRSGSHEIEIVNLNPGSARVALAGRRTIPNRDFVLRYDVTGRRIEDAVLAHRGANGGFFTLLLQPPDKFTTEDVTPKEIVFVLDTSGSMSGFPLEKAKEAMRLSLDNLYPNDTFNLITFAGQTSVLFDRPVPATEANLERARAVLDGADGGGGTEIMTAIRAALEPSDSQEHVRIVCFMTDGLVGNEAEIIGEVQKHPKARVFSFGIGQSVNRHLLDRIASEGRGEAEYVSLADDGSKAARKFYERVRTPLLTDISIDWNGLPVADVYPNRISDLFSAKPVVLHGRYERAASGTIRLKGKIAGQDYVREIAVNLPETAAENDVLSTLWARTKIDELTSQSLKYNAETLPQYLALKAGIARLGLQYKLLTEFTSFVAVEEKIRTVGGRPKKVEVPVELPAGMSPDSPFRKLEILSGLQKPPPAVQAAAKGSSLGVGYGRGSGVGYGSGSGSGVATKVISGGVVNGKATSLAKPPYPAAARAVNAKGAVTVQVTIDEAGNVVSASAVSGHPLLRAAVEQSARSSKFTPTMLSGQAVRVTGVIVYNFVDPNDAGSVGVSVGNVQPETAAELSPEARAERDRLEKERIAEDERRESEARRLRPFAEKFHFWVFAVFRRLEKGEAGPAVNEAKFVAGGTAEVRIYLKSVTPGALEKLKNLGFEQTALKSPKIVAGRIAIEKLAGLARLAEVEYVLPDVK